MNPDGEENWLTSWEQQCISSCDEQPNYEQILIKETDSIHRTVWATFQDSATAIAQLYRGNYVTDRISFIIWSGSWAFLFCQGHPTFCCHY